MKPIDHIRKKVLGISKRQYKVVMQPQRYYYQEELFLNLKRNYV